MVNFPLSGTSNLQAVRERVSLLLRGCVLQAAQPGDVDAKRATGNVLKDASAKIAQMSVAANTLVTFIVILIFQIT